MHPLITGKVLEFPMHAITHFNSFRSAFMDTCNSSHLRSSFLLVWYDTLMIMVLCAKILLILGATTRAFRPTAYRRKRKSGSSTVIDWSYVCLLSHLSLSYNSCAALFWRTNIHKQKNSRN